jgi:hypothetical protein
MVENRWNVSAELLVDEAPVISEDEVPSAVEVGVGMQILHWLWFGLRISQFFASTFCKRK